MTTKLEELEQGFRRRELAVTLEHLVRKIMILSGKGGVGKTTLSVNLAWSRAKSGSRVGLLDIDLHGPSLAGALYTKASPEVDSRGQLIPIEVAPNLWAMSIQYLLGREDEAVMWRGPRKMRAIQQFLCDTAWPELDYFFIDSPPGTGDETLTVIRSIPDLKALLVTTGHTLSLSDVAKAWRCLEFNNIDILGMVDNQSSLVCPLCHGEFKLFDTKGADELAQTMGLQILARLPMDPEASMVADKISKPLVEACPESVLAKKIVELAGLL